MSTIKTRNLIPPGRKTAAKPSNPVVAAHRELEQAEKYRKTGKLKQALAICEALIDRHPDYVGALHTLGLIHIDRQSYWQALSCFVRAAMLNPQDWTILTNLANVYLGLGAEVMAAHTLEQALALNSDDADVHFVLGQIYQSQREYVLAVESFERALKRNPSHAGALHEAGRCYTHLGEIDRAAAVLTKSLQVNREPQNMLHSLYSLGQLPTSVIKTDILAKLDRVSKSIPEPDEKSAIRMAFIRAAALDKQGRHEEAWANLVEANQSIDERCKDACARYLDRHDVTCEYARTQTWKAAKEKGGRHAQPVSLFILGPSRSGKTSLEYLISHIDGVKRGYESGVIDTSVRRTSQLSGLLTLNEPWQLPASLAGRFSDIYREELQKRSDGATVLTNTHPGRIDDVGAMAQSIPYCRFVFVNRNPKDIAIRMYMKHYRDGTNFYAYNIKSIYRQINWYQEMFKTWSEKLPNNCILVDYAEMLEDPRTTMKRVAELCGLPVPDCLMPELGDDRGCAEPYFEFLKSARA